MSSYPRRITEPFAHPVLIDKSGLSTISINATCRSGKQIGHYGGEDLRVEIDHIQLREIPPVSKTQKFNIPPAWSGTQLQGLPKTVVFVLQLTAGKHTLQFIPYRGAEILAEPTVTPIDDPGAITLMTEQQAEDGDRRPWFTCALINLPFRSISIDVS